MSGMISERSANRGSCAQSCRKDYVLTDLDTHQELDRGYLISAKDLAATDHLAEIADAGIGCLKVEGRKKKSRVRRDRDEWLSQLPRPPRRGRPHRAEPGGRRAARADLQPRIHRRHVRRARGTLVHHARASGQSRRELGVVTGPRGRELLVEFELAAPDRRRSRLESPAQRGGASVGFTVTKCARSTPARRFARRSCCQSPVGDGWRVVRSSEAALIERARASYAALPRRVRQRKTRVDVQLFGSARLAAQGCSSLQTARRWTCAPEINLVPASKRALDQAHFASSSAGWRDAVRARRASNAALAPWVFHSDERDQRSAPTRDRASCSCGVTGRAQRCRPSRAAAIETQHCCA